MDTSFDLNRRGRDRVMLDVLVSCRIPAVPIRAKVKDLSRSGCRIRFFASAPERGSSVSIDLGRGSPLVGEVVWQRGPEVGIAFRGGLTSAQAIYYGIEAPPPIAERIAAAPAVPNHGLLSHWVRRITGRLGGD